MTLIEILISMVIGIFLLTGVSQIFTSSKQTYRVQDAMSQLQESGRFAIGTLESDIRMAGNLGCNSQAAITNTLNSSTGYLYNFAVGIEGHEFTGVPDNPDDPNDDDTADYPDWTPNITSDVAAISDKPNRGSDIITIRRARSESYAVSSHASSTANVILNDSVDFECDLAIVENCSSAAIFQITSAASATVQHAASSCRKSGNQNDTPPGNSTADLGSQFQANDQLHRIDTITYYINHFSPPSDPSIKIPTLYRRVNGEAEPMIEGITQLQILYGVDTDSPSDSVANYYTTADNIDPNNWQQVISVRITLSAQTLEDNLGGNNADGTTSTDGRFTREFTSTIGIRNRLP